MVIIDTAGRLGVDEEMMQQAIAIRDATDPDEILFVVDAMIGQDAVATAQAFLDGVGYDGVVLTKLDGDARGGAALSIAQLTGRPIMFASAGEKLEDFDVFHPDRMASRILDMGDMLTLIEQAERTFDSEQAASMAGKLVSGDGFTLEDFVEQLAMVRKLGPIGNLLGMLPGAAQNRDLLSQVSDKDLDRAEAIVNSMTPTERRTPKIINGSRRARIAAGSGVTVTEVNNLVTRFFEGQKMMRQVLGGGGIPGMPPDAGHAPRHQGRQGQEGEEEAQGRPARRQPGPLRRHSGRRGQRAWSGRPRGGRPRSRRPSLPTGRDLPARARRRPGLPPDLAELARVTPRRPGLRRALPALSPAILVRSESAARDCSPAPPARGRRVRRLPAAATACLAGLSQPRGQSDSKRGTTR